MKLYTEEQVENIIALCYLRQFKNIPINVEDVQKQFTPIELPSDEEIAKYNDGSTKLNPRTYYDAFQDGAKWIKTQILNQNK